MYQPSAPDRSPGNDATGRLAAMAGVGFLAASLASDLVIGNFPRPDTPTSQLGAYYAVHHGQVGAGGWLLALAGILVALFGTAIWARIRRSGASPLHGGLVLVGTALTAVTTLASAAVYGLLGDIGGMHGVSPAALQAWHVIGSDGSLADRVSTFAFLAALAGAGVLGRALPRSLAWSAGVVAVLQLAPGQLGFLASIVFLVWAAIAGVVIWRSRTGAETRVAPSEDPAGHIPTSAHAS
jgi:hypothetical protein